MKRSHLQLFRYVELFKYWHFCRPVFIMLVPCSAEKLKSPYCSPEAVALWRSFFFFYTMAKNPVILILITFWTATLIHSSFTLTEFFVCMCMGRGERGGLGVGRGGFMDLLERKWKLWTHPPEKCTNALASICLHAVADCTDPQV